MVFRRLRASRHEARLRDHLRRIDRSLRMRGEYDANGRLGMVLATNYEIVSDATRALHALRCIEELEPEHTVPQHQLARRAEIKRHLKQLVDLPAVPLWRTRASPKEGGISTHELHKLYEDYLGLVGKSTDEDGWKGIDPVELAKRTVAYASHGTEDRWREIEATPPEGIFEIVVPLFESGAPTTMRDQDAFVLVCALKREFEAERDSKGYWNATLDVSSSMVVLQHIWQEHLADGHEDVHLTFWYREMRAAYTAAVRLARRGEAFDASRLGALAVERLTEAELTVTPMRVQLYQDLVTAMAEKARVSGGE